MTKLSQPSLYSFVYKNQILALSMKIAALEDLLKNPDLAGSQSLEILDKFLLYAKLVQDPLNVFRYMEEKAICTYFPLFWYSKSEYLADIGDYRNAFLCLKEAEERKPIDETDQSVKILNTTLKAQIYREQISSEMLRYPPNKRRTVSDFLITTRKFQELQGSEEQKNQKLFTLLQTKFPMLRSQKEKSLQHKNQGKPKSWLHQIYHSQQMIIFEIIHQTIKRQSQSGEKSVPTSTVMQNSTSIQNQQRLFRSVNTPFKRRDPMRMAKTLDSVEMMKRKRKSEDANFHKKFLSASSDQLSENLYEDQNQNDEEEEASISMCTVPVGKAFEQRKKQVKFQTPQQAALRIQKPRNNNHIPGEDDVIQVTRMTVKSHKSILRNKSVEKKHLKESKGPEFSQITERSIQIKFTEERDI